MVGRFALPDQRRRRSVGSLADDLEGSAGLPEFGYDALDHAADLVASFEDALRRREDRVGGMGLDHRIGAKFLHPGPGFGGSCFPKDVAALVQTGQRADCPMEIAEATVRANSTQRARMVSKVRQAAGGQVQGKRIGVLGLSFKPNTNDLRDAPSLEILRCLQEAASHGGLDRFFACSLLVSP